MIFQKYKKSFLVLLFVVAGFLQANTCAADPVFADDQSGELFISELFADAKGVIQPAPEVCNGGSFLQHIHKLKNSFGSNASFSVKQTAPKPFCFNSCKVLVETAKVPIFLFNCTILI